MRHFYSTIVLLLFSFLMGSSILPATCEGAETSSSVYPPKVDVEAVVEKNRFQQKNGVLIDNFLELEMFYLNKAFNYDEAVHECSQVQKSLPSWQKEKNWRLPNWVELSSFFQSGVISKISGIKKIFKGSGHGNFEPYPDAENGEVGKVWAAGKYVYYILKRDSSLEWRTGTYERGNVICVRGESKGRENEFREFSSQKKGALINKKYDEIFSEFRKINTLDAYQKFITDYPKASNQIIRAKALIADLEAGGLFPDVVAQNNIAGYVWFVEKYPDSPKALEAVKRMHNLAFDAARKDNTVEAFNEFIIANPLAEQVKEATRLAYELEKSEYSTG